MYRFMGIYIIDIVATKETLKNNENRVVQKRISDKIKISKYFNN